MYILMGLAGSGKGTQGKLLSEKLGYEYLSTGDYLRTYLTEKRKEEMLKGKLLDDQEMIGIIESFITSLADKTKCILDGFPRTIAQAAWLLKESQKGDFTIEGLIYLDVPEAELMKRLLLRARPDDTEESINERFRSYKESTQPVIDLYRSNSIPVIKIAGNNSIEQVQDDIIKNLKV
ncbi:nucleoside monophosphate kinase [Candidatus Saccharibacteria bacterium]|nr:nucleoside monophosphate kinase [Candidatus Saccharibacteria bacterium]